MFLRSLEPVGYGLVPEGIRQWYEEESSGWFGLGTAEQKKDKLRRLGGFVHQLIELFREDKSVSESAEYGLLVRLFREHCELQTPADSLGGGGNGSGGAEKSDKEAAEGGSGGTDKSDQATVEIVIKKSSDGDTMNSPHDPDAGYGYKGVGYSVQIAETCNNENKPEIITAYEVHSAARSDIGKAPDVLRQLDGTPQKPAVIFADGGYPSLSSMAQMQELGMELVAPVNRGPMDSAVMGRNKFEFDAQGCVIRCPQGYSPIDHRILSNGEKRSLHAVFDGDLCRACPMLETCPVRAPNHRVKGAAPRQTTGNFRLEITPELRQRDEMLAEQQTKEWKDR